MKIRNLISIIVLSLLLVITGCDLLSSVFNKSPGVFEAATKVAPSFEANRSIGSRELAWKSGSGNRVYELFYKLRMYNDEIDGGIIDSSNFYKLMFEVDNAIGAALREGKEIDKRVIQEPFEFGNDFEYDHAANISETTNKGDQERGLAYRMDGDIIHFLISWKYDETGQVTLGQMQGSYDPVLGDLGFEMIYMVEYTERNEKYMVRSKITGNELDHTFDMTMATASDDTMGFHGMTLVGSGISEGESAFFLIKLNDGTDLTMDPLDEGVENVEKYFVFPGNATETTLKEMNNEGTAEADLPDTVTAYKIKIDEMEMYSKDDIPTSLDDFASSSITLEF